MKEQLESPELEEKYFYGVYGLTVVSDFKLSCHRVERLETADVEIRSGKLNKFGRDRVILEENYTYIEPVEVGGFEVRDGCTITVDVNEGVDFAEVHLYLMGTVIGVLLMQRGRFSLHGATLTVNDCSLMICGDSGAGKSSLSRYFVNSNYKLITDDVSAAVIEEDQLLVYPSYPSQKLWGKSLEYFSLEDRKGASLPERNEKYYLEDQSSFVNHPVFVDKIILLQPNDQTDEVSIEQVMGNEKLKILMDNTYRYEYIHHVNRSLQHLKFIADCIDKVDVYRLIRPADGMTVDQQYDIIIQKIYNNNKNLY